MAKKIKNTFEDVMNAAFPNEHSVSWNGVDFMVKRVIELNDVLSLVGCVVESCFDDNGVYMPELKDFAFRMNIIGKYTDITLPLGADKQHALLYRTDLYGAVISEIDESQFAVICNAVEEKIQHECDTQMRELRVRLDKMIESLSAVADGAMSLFGGVSKEDIAKLAKVAGDGKLDEAAVVEAFLAQKK